MERREPGAESDGPAGAGSRSMEAPFIAEAGVHDQRGGAEHLAVDREAGIGMTRTSQPLSASIRSRTSSTALPNLRKIVRTSATVKLGSTTP